MLNSKGYIDVILGHLFDAERRRLSKSINKISEQNEEILNKRLDGFMYQGSFYRHSNAAVGWGNRGSLDLSLWPQMDIYLLDKKKVDHDKDQIHQLLFKLIEPCHTSQDMRNAVPECIINCLKNVSSVFELQRTSEPIERLETYWDIKLYNKVLPKIEFYSAARMIY